jgi:hypothetical protein
LIAASTFARSSVPSGSLSRGCGWIDPSTAAPPASWQYVCASCPRITSSPRWQCAISAARFDCVPEGKKSPASCPKRAASTSCRRFTVGSSPKTSSPTSARAIASRIAREGCVTVSLRRSIMALLDSKVTMNWSAATLPKPQRMGLVLQCEGMGDCLFAMAVFKKLRSTYPQNPIDLFTLHPALFKACPYVDSVNPMDVDAIRAHGGKLVRVFEPDKYPHFKMDTFDFVSVPLLLGNLTFAEKQLEYFPTEEDRAAAFDVVLNTSQTWKTRSWPQENWQRLANVLTARGLTVAVVGRDVESKSDGITKRALPLEGKVTNLANQLSLDQTFFTLRKAGLFVSGQGGLTVLAGATDTEIVVLGMSIEWSRRAIYRQANPFYKVTYVSGACPIYCGYDNTCPRPDFKGDFKCVPTYEQVEAAVLAKL